MAEHILGKTGKIKIEKKKAKRKVEENEEIYMDKCETCEIRGREG